MNSNTEHTHHKWPTDLKKTKSRVKILSILEDADIPISAMDIYSQLEKSEEPIWLSTVYRVLEIFVEKGMIIKNTVLNNEMVLYEINHFDHKHYAICLGCHKMVTMENCPMDQFHPQFEDNSFHVLDHKVEVYGYCKDCDRIK